MTPANTLFPQPDPEQPALSTSFGVDRHLRLQPGERAKWTRLTVQLDCMECAVLQHETRGKYWPRRQAKRRRTLPGGQRLDLCRAHALAWQARDEVDSATPGGAA